MERLLNILRAAMSVLVAAVAGCALAQSPALPSLAPLTQAVEALPRDVLTFLARAENPSDTTQRLSAHLEVPQGWRVLIPPEPLMLAPGAAKVVSFSVLVATNARAGTYAIPLRLHRDDGPERAEATFAVHVSEVHRLDVHVVEAPVLVVAGPYRARFLVTNSGNVAEDVEVGVREAGGFETSVTPGSAHLRPGEAVEVFVGVEVPEDLRAKHVHGLHVVARSRGPAGTEADVRVTVEVAPRALDALAAFHTFPLTVRVRSAVDSGRLPTGLGSAASAVGVDVAGTGRLWEDDPGRFSVRVESSLDFERPQALLQYRHADFDLAGGHQEYTYSPLLAGGNGLGISGTARWRATDDVGLQARAAIYDARGGVGMGMGVAAEIMGGARASAQFAATPRATVASGRLELLSSALPVEAAYRPSVDAEFAVRLSPGPVVEGRAFRVLGGIETEGGWVQVGYEWRDAAFDDSTLDRSDWKGAAYLALNDVLRVGGESPVGLALSYHRRTESAPGAGEASPQRSDVTYGGALSAQFGSVGVTADYQRSSEQDASAGTAAREDALQVSADVTLGEGATLRHALRWQRERSNRQGIVAVDRDALSYSASATVGAAGGRLAADFGASYALGSDPGLTRLDVGASWAGTVAPGVSLIAAGELYLVGEELIGIKGSGSYPMGSGRTLDVEVQATAYRSRTPHVRLDLAYSIPLRVPVGRLSSVGEVAGVMRTGSGEPVAGVTLEVTGMSVATDEDGRFRFPSVPAGEHYLTMRPGALGAGLLVAPALPYPVHVDPGGAVTVELTVFEAARIQGRLRLARTDEDVSDADPAAQRVHLAPGAVDLDGVLVELSDGAVTHRTLTDRNAGFAFEGLLPGRWELRVRPKDWPEEYRLEMTEYVVELAEGDEAILEIDVLFVPRAVRFIDGGPVRTE